MGAVFLGTVISSVLADSGPFVKKHASAEPDGRNVLFPLLDASSQFERYRPDGFKASLMAVYQMWNLLDRYNHATLHNTSVPWVYGYMREVQLEALVHTVQQNGVRTYCEVGFNGGHSAVAVLSSTSNVTVVSFDNSAYGRHTRQNAEQVKLWFPNRFIMHDGNSKDTIPEYGRRVGFGDGNYCDVILVDGSHQEPAALRDLHHFSKVASCRAPVFVDDLDGGPGQAVRKISKTGSFKMLNWLMYDSRPFPGRRAKLEAEDRNVTYIADPQRKLNPCLRFYLHTRAIGKECHTSWDGTKCRLCPPTFEWGIGEYVNARCTRSSAM